MEAAQKMDTTPKTGGLHYAWWIMIASGAVMFGCLGATSACMGVFFPSVLKELGCSLAGLSLYISIFTATMAVFQPIARKIMATYDIRLVMSLAVVISCVGFALLGTYNSLTGFYISGVLIGIGHSFITFQLIPTMIGRWFKEKVGFAMGFAISMNSIGGAVLAPICGYLIVAFGYREAYFLISVIGAVISLPFTIFVLRNNPESKGLNAYGAEKLASQEGVSVEKLAPKGLTFAEATKSPYFYICLLFAFFMSFALNFLVQATNLAYSYGFPVEKGALVASVMTIGGIGGSFLLGAVNDKFGIRVSTSMGILLGVIGLVLLKLGVTSDSIVFIAMAMFGISTALFVFAPPLVTRGIFGDKDNVKIFGFVASAVTVASTVANPVYGILYDKAQNYSTSVVVVIITLLLAMILCIVGVTGGQKRWIKG